MRHFAATINQPYPAPALSNKCPRGGPAQQRTERSIPMTQLPEAFGMSVTVEDMEGTSRFYQELYPHDRISEGVFAGIPYISIMRDGETLVNIFQKGPQNPLANTV